MRTNVLLAVLLLALISAGGVMVMTTRQAAPVPPIRAPLPPPAPVHGKAPSAEHVGAADALVVKPHAGPKVVELPYYVIHDTGTDLVLSPCSTSFQVSGQASTWRQARLALKAMEEFPPNAGALHNPIPRGGRILGVRIVNGQAVVNLSHDFRDNFNGGARDEQMTIYAIVNTVGHIAGVKGVSFQIDGKPIEEFAGHLDLSEPLTPDPSIVEPAR